MTKGDILIEINQIVKQMKPRDGQPKEKALYSSLLSHIQPYYEDQPKDDLEKALEIARSALDIWDNRTHRLVAGLIKSSQAGEGVLTTQLIEISDQIKARRMVTEKIISHALTQLESNKRKIMDQSENHVKFLAYNKTYEIRYYPHLHTVAMIHWKTQSENYLMFYVSSFRKAKRLMTTYL